MKVTALILLLGLHGCQAMEKVGTKRKATAISENLSNAESERIHKLECKVSVLIEANNRLHQDMKRLKAQHDVLFFSYKHMIDAVYAHHQNMEKLNAVEKDLVVRVEDLEMKSSSISSLSFYSSDVNTIDTRELSEMLTARSSSDDEFIKDALFISNDLAPIE